MSIDSFIPKLRTVLTTVGQFVAIMAVIVPALVWTYRATDAKAQAYIQQVVDQRFDELTAQVDELTASINRLVRGQTIETNQSEEEARINRQILCLQELQIDPSSGSIEACQAGE